MAFKQKERIINKNLAAKLAHKRLSILQLAEKLADVNVIGSLCCPRSMDQTSFYVWKSDYGLDELKDLPNYLTQPIQNDWDRITIKNLIAV